MEEGNYTGMLAQQDAMAAQAAMQLTAQPHAQVAAAQWVNSLIVSVSSIPEFDGKPNTLTDFLERETVMNRQVVGSALEDNLRVAIHQMIAGKISVPVRRELGLNVNCRWDESMKKKLKEGYGGARKLYKRQVVSLLNLRKGMGEPPGAYTQMIEATPPRLDEVVGIVREEDEEFKESRRTDEDWIKVPHSRQKKEIQQREYRERGEYKPQAAKPRGQPREEYWPREEYRPRGGRDENRREDGAINSTGYRDRGEPMEINFGEFVREAEKPPGRFVWVEDNRMDTGVSDEEKDGVSSGEESGGSRVVPKKKRSSYAEATGQSTYNVRDGQVGKRGLQKRKRVKSAAGLPILKVPEWRGAKVESFQSSVRVPGPNQPSLAGMLVKYGLLNTAFPPFPIYGYRRNRISIVASKRYRYGSRARH
ncbi:hypothetical protein AAG570_008391 [Ranatra chinensis]|uniref:Uncharacterized protein n=1 Tax=Ranatra chinensis TaxID=642074 RepID=A0ABD0Z1K1_9HEMI